MKKLAMFVVLSMLCCFYAATSLAAQTNYWKFHIVAASRGISIMAINTCGDCQMKGSVRYE